jgi:hypothetical protein
MERIAEKLSEIEKTARAIVDNAQEQKHQMEMQMQKKRDAFDVDMEKETNEKILKIQSDLATNMEKLLKKQEEQNNNEIEFKTRLQRTSQRICKTDIRAGDQSIGGGSIERCDALQRNCDESRSNACKAFKTTGL